MRALLLFALLLVATAAPAQTVQKLTREQSRILLDIQGYERASEAYTYVQAVDYSAETYFTARWLPRDAAFAVARIYELAPNYTFRPSGRGIDASWVLGHLPKFKERQLVFEAPVVDAEKMKLVRFTADPAACVAFQSIMGDIGVRHDSSTGVHHAVVSGVACSQTVKRLTDEDIGRVLAGVRIAGQNGGPAQPVFDTPEALAFTKR
jgi:hypothetical protein